MKKKAFIFLIFLLFSSVICHSQNISPTEMIKNADDLLQGKSNAGTYEMEVTTPAWTRKLLLKVYSENKEKTFIRILSPAKEAGIGTLRIKNEMWNYLPNVERTIKIPPSMMLQPWMGSDFANDDLVKESSIVNDYTHALLKEDMIDGQKVNVIEMIPKPEAAVVWGKILFSIRQADNIPLREEYFDERGRLIKVLDFKDIGPVSDRVIPKVWIMTSKIKEGHSTVIRLKDDVQYNIPIAAEVFSLPYLKKVQ